MDNTKVSFELVNIVMLYQDLSNAKLSRDILFDLYSDEKPQHIDVGPLLAVQYPTHRLEIYIFIDENRVEIKMLSPDEPAWIELPRKASQVHNAISGVQPSIYGYNYFVDIPVPENEDGNQFLVRKFKSSLDPLAQQVQGDIVALSSTINYMKEQEKHQLKIEAKPSNVKALSLRLNVEYRDKEFPSEEELTKSYLAHKEDFIMTIGRLFN